MRVDVYDRDRNKETGEALGWGYYNLDLLAEGQVTDQWVQLRNVVAGELRLRLLVLSGTEDSIAVRSSCIDDSVAVCSGCNDCFSRQPRGALLLH